MARPLPDPRWRARPGFQDPYIGTTPCDRVHAYGHTFRWCRGDIFVGVQLGTVIDSQRRYIIRDRYQGLRVTVGQVPVIDVIPTCGADWTDPTALRRIAEAWAAKQAQHTRHGLDHRPPPNAADEGTRACTTRTPRSTAAQSPVSALSSAGSRDSGRAT